MDLLNNKKCSETIESFAALNQQKGISGSMATLTVARQKPGLVQSLSFGSSGRSSAYNRGAFGPVEKGDTS
jgi:hypothetical protein